MRDRTIDKTGDEIEEACETVFTPPGGLWRNQTWSHLGMAQGGCKPEEISLWVDGRMMKSLDDVVMTIETQTHRRFLKAHLRA